MSKGFTRYSGQVVPLDIANIDTDALIPKQFLQKVTRTGFGAHLFHDWRFLDDAGEVLNPEFVLNKKDYKGATILLVRENFGCGSSREHAPWALADYGFKVIIAPSFADIFYGNCFNNQLLPITLHESLIEELFQKVTSKAGVILEVDLETQKIKMEEWSCSFEIDKFRRYCLLHHLDTIGLTLQNEEDITYYEEKLPDFIK